MDDLLGTRISHYRIIDFLSKGGMGDVYVGFDEKLNRKVVLKSIRAEHRLIAEAKTRFLREARVLSKLAHANICQIFDYIEGDTADFLVLEMIPGQGLAEAMRKGMDYRQKLTIAEQIAGVLVATHAQGIIHRDLKPDNIMLAGDGQVKVLDFGLSRSQQDENTMKLIASASGTFRSVQSLADPAEKSATDNKLTEVGMVMGTIQYMSPEQARGEDASPAGDLYSFGLILQELFTGRPAYENNLSFRALLQKATDGDTLAVEGIDANLAALIERLKSLAPAARPTAVDVAERLAWIRNKPVRRRNKIILAAAIAMLVVFAGAMTIQTLRAVRAEKSALEEAGTANQVSKFLVGIFHVSDPSEAKGNTVTAREILDTGAQKIKTELQDRPLIQARLMGTIGDVYLNLGLFKKAEPLLKKSLLTKESILHSDHPEVAAALNNLAMLYVKQGRYVLAEPLYKRALAIREKVFGPDHADVANAVNNLAILYKEQGKYALAETLYRRSLKIRETALGPDHTDVADSINNLAELFREQGKYAEAEPLYRQSLKIREKALGPEHPDVADSINNLAILYRRQGKYAAAEPLYQRSLKIREKALGPDHPDVAASLNNLANLYNDQGKFATAEPLLLRSLAIMEKALGPNNPKVAISLYNLACLSALRGNRVNALAFLRRALPGGRDAPWMQSIYQDRDLASLRGDAEFERIVAEITQRGKAKEAGQK